MKGTIMKQTLETLVRDGFILVFNSEKLDVVRTAEALQAAGINNMEVTCRISDSVGKVRRLKQEKPKFRTGAASLIDFPAMRAVYNRQHPDAPIPSVEEMVEAGADYLVSAINFSEATYGKYAGKLPIVPGCGTATEIVSQYALGANFCKLFPASVVGGVPFIKGVDPAIHKMISIMPTGGTDCGNIPDYIKAGVLILGGSFSMIEKATMDRILSQGDYALLAAELKKVKQLIDDRRAAQYPGLDLAKASLEEVTRVTGRNFNVR